MGYRPYRGLETLCRTTLVVRQSLMRKVTRASAPGATPAVQPSVALPGFLTESSSLVQCSITSTTPKKKDKMETLLRIRRATRPKALLILRIRGEIRPRDRKRGQTWPGERKEKAEPSFKVYTPCYSL
jgi:hypothetical protein